MKPDRPIRPILLTLALSTVIGCASRPQVERYHPRWPSAGQARIVHQRNLHAGEDMGRSSFLDSLGRLITGESPRRMLRPSSVAVRPGRWMIVSDQELQAVHLVNLKSGKRRFVDRFKDQYFVSPVGVAVCESLFAVADSALNGVYLLTEAGKPVRRIDKPGGFGRPTGLAFDPTHRELYVVDTLAHEVCVFDLEGNLRRRFGARGSDVEQFNYPTHVFVDARGQIYVTDSLNFRVQVFDRMGRYRFDIGRHGDASGHLGVPKGVAVDSQGHIYIVDSYFSTVQIFDAEGRFLLNFGHPGERSGEFQVPTGIAIDADNRIYVCDSLNRRVQIFEYIGGFDDERATDSRQ